jgi:hypothetical protein
VKCKNVEARFHWSARRVKLAAPVSLVSETTPSMRMADLADWLLRGVHGRTSTHVEKIRSSMRLSAVIPLLCIILLNTQPVSSAFVELVLSTGVAKLHLSDAANQTTCYTQLADLKSGSGYETTPIGTIRPKQATCELMLLFSNNHCLCGLGLWGNYTLNLDTTLPPFLFYCANGLESALVLGDACYSGVHDCSPAHSSICPLTVYVPPATDKVCGAQKTISSIGIDSSYLISPLWSHIWLTVPKLRQGCL